MRSRCPPAPPTGRTHGPFNNCYTYTPETHDEAHRGARTYSWSGRSQTARQAGWDRHTVMDLRRRHTCRDSAQLNSVMDAGWAVLCAKPAATGAQIKHCLWVCVRVLLDEISTRTGGPVTQVTLPSAGDPPPVQGGLIHPLRV